MPFLAHISIILNVCILCMFAVILVLTKILDSAVHTGIFVFQVPVRWGGKNIVLPPLHFPSGGGCPCCPPPESAAPGGGHNTEVT